MEFNCLIYDDVAYNKIELRLKVESESELGLESELEHKEVALQFSPFDYYLV